ncbi:MAG TPA: DNA translocase FtsK [Roseiflexaceae bacterium]|nr:DNA translocase FtsK [Roseiflexaceae bacterium]
MSASTDLIIADALGRYLAAQLGERPAARAFFRISGFSTGVYAALLDTLAARGWRLGDTPLEVRSIEPIPGHLDQVMAPGRSATWYRNHLAAGQALVLIQNRLLTDAQSLKDLYSVTELSLSRDGLAHLIEAAFRSYQLDDGARKTLADFVRRLARLLFEPQLRDLTEFLIAVDYLLQEQPSMTIGRAIVLALPHLGLFRCLELEQQLNTPRGDKLIRQLRAAARIGGEVLDERARQDYLRRLEDASFDDDESIGGLGADRKRSLLRRFIEGQLRGDHAATLQVLQIDWREIQLVITAKNRITRIERLSRAADQLEAAVPKSDAAPDSLADVLTELRAGREPDGEMVDRMLVDLGDSLPRAVRNELRRLVKPRTRKHGDFLVGLTALAAELLQPLQTELQPGTRLHVAPNLAAASDEKHLPEALTAFRVLFGGVEHLLLDVDWQLEPLWKRLATREQPADAEDEPERERVVRLELPFRVSVSGPDGAEIARAELIWQYRSDSPAAATALTLAAEHERLAKSGGARLRVPVFNSCPHSEEAGDLDIRRPIHSLGVWFEQPRDLRELLMAALQRRIRPQAEAALDEALARLEAAWAAFVVAAQGGILTAACDALIAAYDGLLHTATVQLRTSQEASAGYRALNQAWMIGPRHFERWAVVPLLHPLKLLWWRERARYFGTVIKQLLDPAQPVQIVDEPRFRRELAATYGSNNFPPVLALPPGEGLPAKRFLPVEEADGYELFFREAEHGEPFGLDAVTLADDEAEIAAQRAVDGITAVVQDYIETYPFVRDGLEIVLYECRNGALPGLLVERLTKASALRGWQVRLSVIVHTTDRGAPLFRRVSEWVAAESAASDRRRGEYFPPISLKVIQCRSEELLRTREDNDIVILADVLAERGQQVRSAIELPDGEDLPVEEYLPTYRAQQEPFQQGENYRRLLLTQPRQPSVARRFLLAQHAAIEGRPVDPAAVAHFYRELTLVEWERDLGQLHDHFNWVICYDTSIDRFLLQSAFPDKVQVIRYSLGLGAKRQHNLTVSSSHKAQAIVERRLATRLAQMLPNATPSFLSQVAGQLVAQAKQVSGDIVLRAAGPGAFLNELIGLVAAKFETERRYRARTPDVLTTWILLDDFEHWFGGGKFPDLLFVAISQGAGGTLHLHLEILEAKCVGQLSFPGEAADAEEQVRRGVSRLALAFAAGGVHLDALYWYDQLYRAVAGNLTVELEQQALWELFRERLHTGVFEVTVEGHAWAFCSDGQVSVASGPDEHPVSKPAQGVPEVPLWAHHYGRNELCQVLRTLIEAGGGHTPAEMWTPAAERPTPTVEVAGDSGMVTGGAALRAPFPVSYPASTQIEEPSTGPAGAPAVANQGPPTGASPKPTTAEPAATHESQEQQWLKEKAHELERALRRRGVQLQPIDPALADVGPSIVRFKLRLSGNETIKKLQAAAEDLARDLALASTPIIANVLRTNFVGVDIPREHPQLIELRPLLDNLRPPGPAELPIVIGVTPDGALLIEDLSDFPHLLVAGATGSGKSAFLRSMLLSLMTVYPVGTLELLIIDPKRTDFTFFNSVPHLRGGKVIMDRNEAREALLELVRSEMPRRQDLLAKARITKVKLFNQRYPNDALPPIVALIDEYALLVSMMSKKERDAFEQDLMILASAARSVSIHLVLATQRPSADIVTSTLKANLPTRIAFRVASSINSSIVLDTTGAENLLGRGDMLFQQQSGEIIRLQAPFMDEEQMQHYLATLGAGAAAP